MEVGTKVPASYFVFGYDLNAVSSWQFRWSFQTPNQPNRYRGGETTNYFLKENSAVFLLFSLASHHAFVKMNLEKTRSVSWKV